MLAGGEWQRADQHRARRSLGGWWAVGSASGVPAGGGWAGPCPPGAKAAATRRPLACLRRAFGVPSARICYRSPGSLRGHRGGGRAPLGGVPSACLRRAFGVPSAWSMLLLAVVLTMSGAGQPSSSVDSLADLFDVDEPPAGSDQFLGDMFGCDADDHGAATRVHTAAQVNPGRSTSAPIYCSSVCRRPISRQGTYDRNGTQRQDV